MSKKNKGSVNEYERSYAGCHGEKVNYDELDTFLEDCFMMNRIAEENGGERFGACIWGHPGIGKTAKAKQFIKKSVEWNGEKYDGYHVADVPIAQFEEMGDLHGMPDRHVLVCKGTEELWVPTDVARQYEKDDWVINHTAGSRTMYAPPDWVPQHPGPSILLLDDWNRAGLRIIKGIMQLLQNYGLCSWKLPPGCNLVLTANPDEQDYLVTTIDPAILTRLKSVTLKEDAAEWAVWAQSEGLDERGISFVLQYKEMMLGKEKTNPRTLSEYFRFLKRIPDLSNKENLKRAKMQAYGLLDEETVAAMITFFQRDIEMLVEPEQILMGDDRAFNQIKDLMTRDEPRMDCLGVIMERLYAHIVQPDTKRSDERRDNFQKLLTMEEIPADMLHGLCRRIVKRRDEGQSQKWLIGNKKLKEIILDTLKG
jgi:MoxR-like ATPase